MKHAEGGGLEVVELPAARGPEKGDDGADGDREGRRNGNEEYTHERFPNMRRR
jgi:hypothetical protein